ncbi:hypothetical protein KQX54_017434 [Cotesia glomerata]|uniref:Uncharacterized protein n=1 Tax=Cotesia glomerata TaxID=32391 RepID=A0AAV7IQT4_COTGL|nr:hypothetical protein KQX54_017434 [Cotesia glomerata]
MRNPGLRLVGLTTSPSGGGVFGTRAEEELRHWLESRLDALGIDPVAYSRFVLSLLRRPPDSALSPLDEDIDFAVVNRPAGGGGAGAGGRRHHHRVRPRARISGDRDQRRAVVQCLTNAADQIKPLFLDTIDGVQLHEYAIAVGNKVGPENIRHLSRIANNRVCIYMSSKEVADALIDKFKTVKLRDTNIVVPKLKEFKVNPISNISTLRAGLNIPGYQHILSFRRQVFIKPEEQKLASSSTNSQPSADTNTKDNSDIITPPKTSVASKPTFPPLPLKIPNNNEDNRNTTSRTGGDLTTSISKRPRSNGSSPASLPTQHQLFSTPSNKDQTRLTKKPKSDPKPLILPPKIEQAFKSSPTDYPCAFPQLAADTAVMLRKLYNLLNNRKQKHLTRTINRIEGNVLDETSSQSSIASNSSLMEFDESAFDPASAKHPEAL